MAGEKPRYGLDASWLVVVSLATVVVGALLVLVALVPSLPTASDVPAWSWYLGVALLLLGTALAGLIFRAASTTRFRARDAMVEGIRFEGSGRVLDVGCGSGLLLFGALRQHPGLTGWGTALFEWRSGPSARLDRFWSNARAEGVAERASLALADPRALPFRDGSFDAVLSRRLIGQLKTRQSFEEALLEMGRLVRPGGRLALSVEEGRRFSIAGELLERTGFVVTTPRPRGSFAIPLLLGEKPRPSVPPPEP